MNLIINNLPNSGASDEQVFVCITGHNPIDDSFSYYDFDHCIPVPNHVIGITSKALNKISIPIKVPSLKSARIYLAINSDFINMTASGLSPSKDYEQPENNILYDKIEFDTSTDNCIINPTSVDFYGFSYTVSVIPIGEVTPKTVGITTGRTNIFNAFKNIPANDSGPFSGNTAIYQQLFVFNEKNEVVRLLSPKTMAYSDWNQDPTKRELFAQYFTHYFDDYINNRCFIPGRKFSFFSKDFIPDSRNPVFFGKISDDGKTLLLFADEPLSEPYQPVPFLINPSSPRLKLPGGQYHNVVGNDPTTIDWGYLISGNVIAGSLWSSDPVTIAILVSICRGVMHLDKGHIDWINSSNYYKNDGAVEFYSKLLHESAQNGKVYALSLDDVYGNDPTISFQAESTVTINLNSLEPVNFS